MNYVIASFMVAHSWTQLTPRLRRQAGTVFLFNTGLGGQDAVPYIARSLGLTAARLTAALATCESRFSFVCMHGDPPAGRPQIHRDCCGDRGAARLAGKITGCGNKTAHLPSKHERR